MPVSLGPFELHDIAGRGGMGVVYRATLGTDGTPVAVKLLLDEGVLGADLDREIEATAGLVHPGIVAVYDSGRVPAGHPEFAEGAPYFAMEFLDGGSLAEVGNQLGWMPLRSMLLAVFDALAHAHARGVLHLDLKPANVMRDRAGSWRLVDFGISSLVQDGDRVMGTPAYMAPEQLRGEFAAFGPGTDLYAVGVLAWTLVCGEFPRDGQPSEILARTMAGNLPAFSPRMVVPPGLEDWLRRLLAAGLEERFAFAADAAFSLARLPLVGSSPSLADATPKDVSATFTLDPVTTSLDRIETLAHATAPPPSPHDHPPIPRHFARADLPLRPLANLGLALFALRPLPYVGRDPELDALWAQLVEVCDRGDVRMAAITGHGGVGKTRLASEVAWRAHEVGAARVIRLGGGPDALRTQLAGAPRPPSGSPEETAWAQWQAGGDPGRDARHALAARALRRLAQRRPVLLFVDDADSDPDALALAQLLLEQGEGPIQVLLVDRHLDLNPDPPLRLALEPLGTQEMTRMLRSVLGLEARSARALADLAHGHPRFLAHALAHAVERSQLTTGARGYVLQAASLPEQTREVQLERLRHWLGPAPSDAWKAVQLAAVLGTRMKPTEWQACCAAAGISWLKVPRVLGLRLGLMVYRGNDLALADADLRQSVLDGIDPELSAELHRLALDHIDPEDHDRRARHALAAGVLDQADVLIHRAALLANRDGDVLRTRSLFLEHAALLERMGEPPERAAKAMGWVAWTSYLIGDFDQAKQQAEEVVRIGEELGDDYLIASGWHTQAAMAAARVEPGAVPLYNRAADHYARCGNHSLAAQALGAALESAPPSDAVIAKLDAAQARAEPISAAFCMMRRAHVLWGLGRLGDAVAQAGLAVGAFERTEVRDGQAGCERLLADLYMELDDLDSALSHLDRARALRVDDHTAPSRLMELSRGLLALRRGQMVEGARILRRQHAFFAALPWLGGQYRSGLGMVVVRAWEGLGPLFDATLRQLRTDRRRMDGQPTVSPGPFLELAATLWEAQHDSERAAAARALAAELAS